MGYVEEQDTEERGDASLTPVTMEVHATTGAVRVSIRSYYSSRLLWTAQHHAELAGELERALAGKTPFSIEHHGYVLSSIIASVAFLEAMVNELFQDAADARSGPDAYIAPLSEDCRRLMAALWKSTREGFRLGTVESSARRISPTTRSWLAPATHGGPTMHSVTEPRSGRIAPSRRSPITCRTRSASRRTTVGRKLPDGSAGRLESANSTRPG